MNRKIPYRLLKVKIDQLNIFQMVLLAYGITIQKESEPMLNYNKYEDLIEEDIIKNIKKEKRKLKKMKRPAEERNRGRKLNKRTKKKARDV